MKHLLSLVSLTLLLSGCASWFGGKDNVEPPAELVPLDNKIDIKKLWSSNIGSGTGGYRVKLVPPSPMIAYMPRPAMAPWRHLTCLPENRNGESK